jgi:hypothetical protein
MMKTIYLSRFAKSSEWQIYVPQRRVLDRCETEVAGLFSKKWREVLRFH